MEKESKTKTVKDNPAEPDIVDPVKEKPQEDDPKAKWQKKYSKIIWVIFLIIVVLAGAGVWLLGEISKNDTDRQIQESPAKAPSEDALKDPELARFINPKTGETWLKTPKPIERQGWMVAEDRETYRYPGADEATITRQYELLLPKYFEVGARAGNKIIMVENQSEIGSRFATLFEQTKDGKVFAVVKPMSTIEYDNVNVQATKNLVKEGQITAFDENTRYDSLSIPTKIPLGDGDFVGKTDRPFMMSKGSNVFMPEGTVEIEVMKLGSSRLMRLEKKYADTKLTNVGYYIDLPFGMATEVQYQPNKESLSGYSFDNNIDLTDGHVHAIARGCGGTTAAVTRSDSLTQADLKKVGKTDTGRIVYQPVNKDHQLIAKAYDEYTDAIYDGSQVSLDEFLAQQGLMVIKNGKGEWLVYIRDEYSLSGGCAKPVVYLYPTAPTKVSVRVGADVTVSDPQYPAGGWRGVLAQPNGQLFYNGQTYDSLFWEGYGSGQYPGIVSGTVVKRAEAASTIRRQLAEQGLDKQEISDFMDFWTDKIPNKPYIRLTWLNTTDMNRLAPLYVIPKPTTTIRVFLDMDGYDKPISLPKQTLKKTERRGFTVVEWGGLLAGGLR